MKDPCIPAGGIGESDLRTELLARWQEQGDHEALDQLLRLEIASLKTRIRRDGRGMMSSSQSSSDIAQEVALRFLGVGTALRFEHLAALRAYLWTAAWRLLLSRLEKAGRYAGPLDEGNCLTRTDTLASSDGMEEVEERERSVAISVALHLLAPCEQEILDLVYLQQLGLKGAAARLGISRNRANTKLVRARRSLANKLRGWKDLIEAP